MEYILLRRVLVGKKNNLEIVLSFLKKRIIRSDWTIEPGLSWEGDFAVSKKREIKGFLRSWDFFVFFAERVFHPLLFFLHK